MLCTSLAGVGLSRRLCLQKAFTRNTFHPASLQTSHHIDVHEFGAGNAKSLQDLWQEVHDGETVLDVSSGLLTRHVTVLTIYITNNKQQVLQEEFQILPRGTKRARGVPLSEKMKAGETWPAAVQRAVKEELGSALPSQPDVTSQHSQDYLTLCWLKSLDQGLINSFYDVRVDEGSHEVVEETGSSHSYPGLPCKYTIHKVKASVSGLPERERFVTREERPDGVMENHWLWMLSNSGSSAK